MYGSGVKPIRATGTRWIDHKLRAMQRTIDKFGLYTQHLQNIIADTSKVCDRATIQGKFNKLIDSKVLLRIAFLTDVLSPAKIFSLATQRRDVDIIQIVDDIESTKSSYERLLRKFKKNPEAVFNRPTLKAVVDEIESNEDSDVLYQNQKLKYYIREKTYVKDHAAEVVQKILTCYDERYARVCYDGTADAGDVLYDVCCVLNSQIWPLFNDDESDEIIEEKFSTQLSAINRIFNRYGAMEAFKKFTSDNVVEGFIDIVRYAKRYFETENMNSLEFWSKLAKPGKDKTKWSGFLLILELCLCAPVSNATLERLFSHMNIVKSDLRSRLSATSLNAILRIRITGYSLWEFHENHIDKCVDFWYHLKDRRMSQGKRKKYKQRESGGKNVNNLI